MVKQVQPSVTPFPMETPRYMYYRHYSVAVLWWYQRCLQCPAPLPHPSVPQVTHPLLVDPPSLPAAPLSTRTLLKDVNVGQFSNLTTLASEQLSLYIIYCKFQNESNG